MTWKGGFDGVGYTPEDAQTYLDDLPAIQWPRMVVLHNTAPPSLAQVATTPGGLSQRILNLRDFYRQKWSAGPHAFILLGPGWPGAGIFWGTPLSKQGIHSPSWNASSWGVEMGADFDTDDDDSGNGLKVKELACKLIAMMLQKLGLPADNDTIKLHREDAMTTHRCPGKHITKDEIVQLVQAEYDAMGTPGEHVLLPTAAPVATPATAGAQPYLVRVDGLNLRQGGGMAGRVIASLAKGQTVKVWSVAKNASTAWAHVTGSKDGKAYFDGYVALQFLDPAAAPKSPTPVVALVPAPVAQPAPAAAAPTPVPAAPVSTAPARLLNVQRGMLYYVNSGLAAFKAAGILGNGMQESYEDLRVAAVGDKELGDLHSAHGLFQWRDDRWAHYLAFAKSHNSDPEDLMTQFAFVPYELSTTEKLAGGWLKAATTLEEAVAAMVSYERPAGWLKLPTDATLATLVVHAERAHGWAQRVAYAKKALELVA